MRQIKAGFLNETGKIFSRKKYRVLLILSGIFCILIGLLARYANTSVNLSISNLPLSILSLFIYAILPLMIFMSTADLFTSEQENKSIKAIITRPVDHINVFASKVLAILVYCGSALGICFVIGSTVAILTSGMSPLDIVKTILAYLVSCLPLLTIILFSAFISQVAKSSSGSTILSVFGYIALLAIGTIFPAVYPFLFTSYTGWYKLFIGSSIPFSLVINVTALFIAYSLLLFVAGGTLFRRKEY